MDYLKEKINMKQTSKITLYLCFLVGILVSCNNHKDEYHNVIEKIEAESVEYKGATTSESFISEYHTIEITEGEHTFLIPERKSQIKSYACTECHSKTLKELQNHSSGKKAHWDIQLNHAKEFTMNCATCHNGEDMNNLKSLTNDPVDFNKSYKVCSQCHAKQFEDWKGGAHGKRLESWAPPRLSNTCVNCHNPHDPHIKSKFPDRFNTEYENERN